MFSLGRAWPGFRCRNSVNGRVRAGPGKCKHCKPINIYDIYLESRVYIATLQFLQDAAFSLDS